jgi:GntR family transcriptional regulator
VLYYYNDTARKARHPDMNIKINTESGVPIYLQIVEQVRNMVLCGALKAGDRLPSVRELSVELRINPNTVAKSYRDLQHEEVIDSRWGEGNFISDKCHGASSREKKKVITEALENLLRQAESYGLGRDETRSIISEFLDKHRQ